MRAFWHLQAADLSFESVVVLWDAPKGATVVQGVDLGIKVSPQSLPVAHLSRCLSMFCRHIAPGGLSVPSLHRRCRTHGVRWIDPGSLTFLQGQAPELDAADIQLCIGPNGKRVRLGGGTFSTVSGHQEACWHVC